MSIYSSPCFQGLSSFSGRRSISKTLLARRKDWSCILSNWHRTSLRLSLIIINSCCRFKEVTKPLLGKRMLSAGGYLWRLLRNIWKLLRWMKSRCRIAYLMRGKLRMPLWNRSVIMETINTCHRSWRIPICIRLSLFLCNQQWNCLREVVLILVSSRCSCSYYSFLSWFHVLLLEGWKASETILLLPSVCLFVLIVPRFVLTLT